MHFQNLHIHPLLKDYVEKLWVFESNGKALDTDIKLIAPNGRMKIAVPYRNAIIAEVNGNTHLTKEHSITLVGYFDVPSSMNFNEDSLSGTICAELNPRGAYRFFHLRFKDIQNVHISLSDILGKTIRHLEEQIANAVTVEGKVFLFQQFLLDQFSRQTGDPFFEFCVSRIISSGGAISIAELEKTTGYSSRWINMKFIERLGVNPKNFISLVRFKNYYEILCHSSGRNRSLPKEFYNYYYDQSHFIKDFKRFTGFAPLSLEKKVNEFGKLFYNV